MNGRCLGVYLGLCRPVDPIRKGLEAFEAAAFLARSTRASSPFSVRSDRPWLVNSHQRIAPARAKIRRAIAGSGELSATHHNNTLVMDPESLEPKWLRDPYNTF